MSKGAASIAQALAQAQAMGGQPGEPGLESPTGQRILQNLGIAAGGYSMGNLGGNIAQALVQQGLPMAQGLGEAGAIFPEGMQMPQDRTLLKEFGDVIPESEKIYRRNEALANWHASNMDFPAVLRDKWALLKNSAGNY